MLPLAELKFQHFRNNQLESSHRHPLSTSLYSSDHITAQSFPHFQNLLRNAFIGFILHFKNNSFKMNLHQLKIRSRTVQPSIS